MALAVRFQYTVNIDAIQDIEKRVQVELVVAFMIPILMKRFQIRRVVRDIDIGAITGQKAVTLECSRDINSHQSFRKDAEKKLKSLLGDLGTLLTEGRLGWRFIGKAEVFEKLVL